MEENEKKEVKIQIIDELIRSGNFCQYCIEELIREWESITEEKWVEKKLQEALD